MSGWIWRAAPWLAAIALAVVAWLAWPGKAWRGGWLGWANQALLWAMIALLLRAGVRARKGQRPSLRTKLLAALGVLLFVPAIVVQTAANAIVERGMEVWFDVRVERLLDAALSLARGLYQREQAAVRRDLAELAASPLWQSAALGAMRSPLVQRALEEAAARFGWQRLQLLDPAGRVWLSAGKGNLELEGEARLGEAGLLALRLGRVASEVISDAQGDRIVAYAPVLFGGTVVALLRAEQRLPAGLAAQARAIARDYSRYQTLAHNRAALAELFAQVILFVTLLVVGLAGIVASAFARRMAQPAEELAKALARVAEGDFSVQLRIASEDEFGVLAEAFNRMVMQLRRSMQSLARAQQELANALRESRQRQRVLEALLAQLDVGVLLLDDAGSIRLVNEAWRRLFAAKADWPVGARFADRAPEQVQAFAARITTSDAPQREEFDLASNGTVRRIALAGTRVATAKREGFSGILLVAEDITELARIEKARAWAEVARRLAHEIKNPLTPIRLSAERLRRRLRKRIPAGEDAEIFDACTQAIVDQVDRLQRLVADFSAFARAPKPRLRRVDARAILGSIADLYRPRPAVRVELPKEELWIEVDPDQIKQVLINLIENALAMLGDRAQEGAVRVRIEEQGDAVGWIVEDDGPGVPEKLIERIFEPYVSTREGGTGLGLAIARRIANEHGGELLLVSRANPTRFVLRLPRHRPSISQG